MDDGAQKPLFAGFDFKLPSPDELKAERETAYAWTRDRLIDANTIATREAGAPAAQMNCLSLPAWLALAQRAGIEFIPARPLAEVDAENYLDTFDHREGEAGLRYQAFHDTVVRDLAPGEMVRMEQVAPYEIKSLMSGGEPMSSGLFTLLQDGSPYLDLHEDRFYVTFKDLGADRVRAFARPIVTPLMIDGDYRGASGRWPAEFRVFVESGMLVGISNYYPQVAMDPEVFAGPMREVRLKAQAMLDTMDALHLAIGNHKLCADRGPDAAMEAGPAWRPAEWGAQNFTLDFMLLEDGRVVFLEGGPAGLIAAHPCCFLQEGREIEPDFLHGVAWSTHIPVVGLDTLDT